MLKTTKTFHAGRAGREGLQNVFLSVKTPSSPDGSSKSIFQVPKSQRTQENYLLLSKATHSMVDCPFNIQNP